MSHSPTIEVIFEGVRNGIGAAYPDILSLPPPSSDEVSNVLAGASSWSFVKRKGL
jgi:hypothetical protein